MSILVKSVFLLFIWANLVTASDKLEQTSLTPNAALDKGKLLRAQFKLDEAQEYLQFSAQAGLPEAQYLYGISLLTYKPTARKQVKAKDYLQQAAEQGHLGAMQVLVIRDELLDRTSRYEWQQRYEQTLHHRKKDNPGYMSYQLYLLYNYLDQTKDAEKYLNVAFQKNDAQAIYTQAKKIMQGEGFYITDSSRTEHVNQLLKQSAELGYIPAYRLIIQNYEKVGEFDSAYVWRERLLQQADLLSLASMGKILVGRSNGQYQKYLDISLGLEYLHLYLTYAGQDKMQAVYIQTESLYQETLGELSEKDLNKFKKASRYSANNVKFYSFDLYQD